MSDLDSQLPLPDPTPEPAHRPRPTRLRRFFLRHLPLTLAGVAALIILVSIGLCFWMSSEQFEGMVRKRLRRRTRTVNRRPC